MKVPIDSNDYYVPSKASMSNHIDIFVTDSPMPFSVYWTINNYLQFNALYSVGDIPFSLLKSLAK